MDLLFRRGVGVKVSFNQAFQYSCSRFELSVDADRYGRSCGIVCRRATPVDLQQRTWFSKNLRYSDFVRETISQPEGYFEDTASVSMTIQNTKLMCICLAAGSVNVTSSKITQK
jgi:hypothetical protein